MGITGKILITENIDITRERWVLQGKDGYYCGNMGIERKIGYRERRI